MIGGNVIIELNINNKPRLIPKVEMELAENAMVTSNTEIIAVILSFPPKNIKEDTMAHKIELIKARA